MITVTELAAEKIKEVMAAQNLEPDRFLRLSVTGGGCSGLQYGLAFDSEFISTEDADYHTCGIRLVTRKKVAPFMDGTVIDYKTGAAGTGFSIENPTFPAGGGCRGCGGH